MEKTLRAEEIARNAIQTGRNPTDTAGLDTDDELWLSENSDYEDYINEVWKKGKVENKAKVEKLPDNLSTDELFSE